MIEKIQIDAKDKSVGHVATEISNLLNGKNKPEYRPHVLQNVQVEVINAKGLKVGGKIDSKNYYRHTGYMGHLKKDTMRQVVEKHGYREVLRRAVYGMLPKNRLRDKKIKNLIINE